MTYYTRIFARNIFVYSVTHTQTHTRICIRTITHFTWLVFSHESNPVCWKRSTLLDGVKNTGNNGVKRTFVRFYFLFFFFFWNEQIIEVYRLFAILIVINVPLVDLREKIF